MTDLGDILVLTATAIAMLCAAVFLSYVAVSLVKKTRWFARPTPGQKPPIEPDDGTHFCRHCGYDIRGGLERCPECGLTTFAVRRRKLEELRSKIPPTPVTPREPDSIETLVQVYMTDHQALIDLLAEHLEARGILTRTERPTPSLSVLAATPEMDHRLFVWSGDVDFARTIIEKVWPEQP